MTSLGVTTQLSKARRFSALVEPEPRTGEGCPQAHGCETTALSDAGGSSHTKGTDLNREVRTSFQEDRVLNEAVKDESSMRRADFMKCPVLCKGVPHSLFHSHLPTAKGSSVSGLMAVMALVEVEEEADPCLLAPGCKLCSASYYAGKLRSSSFVSLRHSLI